MKTARINPPFQWTGWVGVLGLLLTVGSAEARNHTYGQAPGLGSNLGTRALNGTTFETHAKGDNSIGTTPAQEFAANPDDRRPSFIIDSSLPATEWWATTSQTTAWNSVQGANVTGNFFAMQVRDPVPLPNPVPVPAYGGSFYFGFSWEFNIQSAKNDHGIFGDGSSFKHATLTNPTNMALPEGTVIYYGMSRFGAPNSTAAMLENIDNVNRTGAFTDALGAPPPGTFPGNPSAFGWVTTTKNNQAGEIEWLYGDTAGVQYEYTEVVYVIVLPEGWSYDPGDNDINRLTFVWTVDARGFDPDVPPDENPNFGNILVPEPGRAVLVGLGMFWLLWRRRR